MQRIGREELEVHAEAWDASVARDSDLDPVCSRSAWQLSYHDAFEPGRELHLARQGDDLALLAERPGSAARPVLEPLESMWGFAAPLIGPNAAELLARSLLERPAAALLLGLPIDHARLEPLGRLLAGRFAFFQSQPTTRFVASLESGIEGWLSRRRPAFRRNLRAALRAVRSAGIRFRWHEAPGSDALPALYAEILDVERRSWKATLECNGADQEPMRSFYANLWPRLAAKGQLRVLLAERAGRPVGYLHGALVEGHFRGLQFSFDHRLRDLGLGNALQFEALERLCAAGAHAYDLGAHSEYKARWGEAGLRTIGLLLRPVDTPRTSAR